MSGPWSRFVVVVVVLFNVFKQPNGYIGRPSLCPSYIERLKEREMEAMLASEAVPPRDHLSDL
jgi:hypothetical protein